jgi:hypothetical protein
MNNRPNQKDEAKATRAAKVLCKLIAKYGIKGAQFSMRVDNGPFEGVNFTVTVEADEGCLCEDCLNQERDAE